MIKLKKLNGSALYLNPLLIESVELVPDTVITLTNGKTIIVQDDIQYITDAMLSFFGRFHVFPVDYYGNSKE